MKESEVKKATFEEYGMVEELSHPEKSNLEESPLSWSLIPPLKDHDDHNLTVYRIKSPISREVLGYDQDKYVTKEEFKELDSRVHKLEIMVNISKQESRHSKPVEQEIYETDLFRNEQFFNQNKKELLKKFNGLFVGIINCKVVDSDINEEKLVIRLYDKFGYVPMFITKVTG